MLKCSELLGRPGKRKKYNKILVIHDSFYFFSCVLLGPGLCMNGFRLRFDYFGVCSNGTGSPKSLSFVEKCVHFSKNVFN